MGFSKSGTSAQSRMGRLTSRDGNKAAGDNQSRGNFFHQQLDKSSKIIRDTEDLENEYGSSDDEETPLQERVDSIIKSFYERFGSANASKVYPGDDKWNLIVAGEQKVLQRQQQRRERELINKELKLDKTENDVDKEAWILVARGDTKELPDDHLVDLDGKKWYPLAQGGGMYHESRGTNFKKLSCWGGEKEEDERPWDLENMPIQTGEFVHFGHQPGLFRTIRRQPHQDWHKIKGGKTMFEAYAIDNVSNDVYDMKAYFKQIVEQSIEEEQIMKTKTNE